MKKLISICTAVLLLLAALPVFAFTGYDEEPPMPDAELVLTPFFDFEIVRVENEPQIAESEWGEEYYEWIPMDDTQAEAGETVTYALEYSVPATIEGFTEEELQQITVIATLNGIELTEIVDATGLEINLDCDYETGLCLPMPGYANAYLTDTGVLVIEPKLNTTVQIIVQGTANGANAKCIVLEAVGQTSLPTHYSIGKVEPIEGGYYVYKKDIAAVQIRGMKFFAEEGLYDHYYVCLNDIDYIRSADTKGTTYTSVEDPSVVITEGTKFQALERAYNDIMGFFEFTDDDIHDVLTDSVFLVGSEPESCFFTIDLFTEEGEPVDPTEPVEPTEPAEPTEPTEPSEPAEPEPTDMPPEPIAPPVTGAASLAFLGVLSVAAGAAVIALRKRNK